MASPGLNAVHVDTMLSNLSVAYMQDDTKFIAGQVFPDVPVEHKSGAYWKFNLEDWLRDEAQKRADTTESAGSGYTLGKDFYNAEVWAFHKDVGDQLLANADSAFAPIQEAVNFVTSRLLLRKERDFGENFLKPGVWANNATGTATGSGAGEFMRFNETNSNPIAVIEDQKEKVAAVTGFDVNTMVMGKRVFNALKQHPEIYDRIKYTTGDNITLDLIARMFEVDKVLVSSSLVNTAREGATAKIEYNFADGILMTHSASSPGLLTPSAGYNFVWNGVSDGAGLAIGTTQFRLEAIRAERIESQVAWDNKVVAPELGIFLANAVAPKV